MIKEIEAGTLLNSFGGIRALRAVKAEDYPNWEMVRPITRFFNSVREFEEIWEGIQKQINGTYKDKMAPDGSLPPGVILERNEEFSVAKKQKYGIEIPGLKFEDMKKIGLTVGDIADLDSLGFFDD